MPAAQSLECNFIELLKVTEKKKITRRMWPTLEVFLMEIEFPVILWPESAHVAPDAPSADISPGRVPWKTFRGETLRPSSIVPTEETARRL